MKINCIVIDDEPSSQNVLKSFIYDIKYLQLLGVFSNAIDANEFLRLNKEVNLLFLDINMPKITGLNFYKSLKNPPEVIFTTAYPQYAVEGFEVNAIDYLLKPFSFDRFFTAVNKMINNRLPQADNNYKDEHLIVKSNKVLHKILFEDIYFIEALGDYVKIHLKDTSIVTNSTFTNILKSLPDSIFIRTHKSFAIHLGKLKSISGNQITIGAYKVPIGQKYKADFIKLISS